MNYFQRLKDMREDHDLKQEFVANLLKIKRQQYARYEAGIHQMAIEHYKTLARYYNVSIDFLAGLTNVPRTVDGKPYQITGKNVVTFNAPVKGNIDIH